jgi:hypothetical protein
VEILWLDDHSRYALSVTAHRRVTGPIVVEEFRNTYERQGIPYSTPTDNGMVFTTRFAGGKGGRAPSRRIGAYRVPPRTAAGTSSSWSSKRVGVGVARN